MVFGNKPGKKAKSLLISDRRKLSLLNVDFKLMTGIEAARIRKTMSRTVSPLQLVTGGEKRISHGIAMARDAIHIAGKTKARCGILDTDLIAAFCNMVATWCYQVLERKGLCTEVTNRYRNLYTDNLSVIVVNNIQGKCIRNIRQSIRQGDKFSMELFSYGMDPILGYLERRLQGILIHSIPVQGPVLIPRPPPPLAQLPRQSSQVYLLCHPLHPSSVLPDESTTSRYSQFWRPGTCCTPTVMTLNQRSVTYGSSALSRE